MLAHRSCSLDSSTSEEAFALVRGSISEVMTMERAVKNALVPIASAALGREVNLFCEVTQGVGEFVLGERRQFSELIARAAAPATAAAPGGVVCVRIARQHAGFDATDRLLVSVSIRHGDKVEDAESFEMTMPIARSGDAVDVTRELAGTRVLLVLPGAHLAAVQRVAVRRFGAVVESVSAVEHARERMRDATRTGGPFDVLYLDDQAAHVTDVLEELRADASLGGAHAVVGTALPRGPMRDAYQASGAARTLSKPVLPFELRDTILQLRAAGSEVALSADVEAPISTVVATRRPSGMRRRFALAEVLASIAVGPEPFRR